MPDIALRFHRDMLVLSSPVERALERSGVDTERDMALTLLLEPEVLEDYYRLEAVAGVQCMVTPTAAFTPLRLTQAGMEDRGAELAPVALGLAQATNPQHILVELGPCGLPLDPSSKGSLNENRSQYARAARLFESLQFDAFFLNGFRSCDDLRCALMGLRQVSDALIFASVDVRADGLLANGRSTWLQACALMEDLGAAVAGFTTTAPLDVACRLAEEASQACLLPLMAQLFVKEHWEGDFATTPENPYGDPESMEEAASALRSRGVQFLRAVGDATPAYPAVLVASTSGLDVEEVTVDSEDEIDGLKAQLEGLEGGKANAQGEDEAASPELYELAAELRQRVAESLSSRRLPVQDGHAVPSPIRSTSPSSTQE